MLRLVASMQTGATCHNIVSPTMLEVVGTCCVVRANERNNCQRCWRSSKETIYSGTVILAMRVRRRFYEANVVVAPCKRAQHCCATLRRSQNNRYVGTCCAKSLTAVSNCTQQVPAVFWFHANGRNMLGPTMLRRFA